MTPAERQQRTTAVFELALQLPPEDRDRFLVHECGGDNTLLEELRSLLSGSRNTPEPSRSRPMPRRIGRYEITDEIGSGGFGHVYSALDPTVGRSVAIKVLNAPDDQDLVRRFRSEATTSANLHHKNIVTIHEFGEENGAPYLVMEYLAGTNLQEIVRQGTPLSLQEKLSIMSEVAEGLQYAHDRGVVHRDVKPANIMRLTDGSVKIMDFGIARLARQDATRLTQTGLVVGSLMYMAPEQFSGISDAQCDIFAYGVTLYEFLTGSHPFPASGDPAVAMYRIMQTEPPPLRSLLPECPDAVENIVSRALAKSREARYSSLADLVVDTKPILLDLRRREAVELFCRATEWLRGGQLDAAQSGVRRALELDPWHPEARQLRSRIEEARHRRDLSGRASAMLDRAEQELSRREVQKASEYLADVKRMSLDDEPLKSRLDKLDGRVEQLRNVLSLLDAARADIRAENLTEAIHAISQALILDPGNAAGQDLLQEVRTRMNAREARRRTQEAISRVESLLTIGLIDQALALLAQIEAREPSHKELPALRARAEAAKAAEQRARRFAEALGAVRNLLKNGRFAEVVSGVDKLLAEFPGHPDLLALRHHASEQLSAQSRAGEIRQLKTDAAVWIERGEYDRATRELERGVVFAGNDDDFTRLLQTAATKKASQEREQAVARLMQEVEALRRQGSLADAVQSIERGIQAWGGGPPLQNLLASVTEELHEKERRQRIGETLRSANAFIGQDKADAAIVLLREAIQREGEEAALRSLLATAEAVARDRARSARLQTLREKALKLVDEKQRAAASRFIEEALEEFPNDQALVSLRTAAVAPTVVPAIVPVASPRRFPRWQVVGAAIVVTAILLVFVLRLVRNAADAPFVQAQSLIQARKWAEAQRRIDDFTVEGRQDDPRVVEMRQQIEQGRKTDIVSLLGAIATALSARQWKQGWDYVNKFEELAPDDPRLAPWRKQVEAGIASERAVDGLRESIRTAIGEKDWAKAETEVTSLLAKAPGDPQGVEWRKTVELGRDADLASRSLATQRQQQEETDLANAEKFRQQGAYPAAIKLFQQVLSQDPGSVRAQTGLKQATDAKAAEDRVFGRGH